MTTDTHDIEAIKRRIAKLLAIAEDDRADSNEAAAAAAMAAKIMAKFQLENADVVRRDLDDAASFGTEVVAGVMKAGKGHKPTKVPGWAQWIAVSVAWLHDCEVRSAFTPELGACLRFFGYKHDVELARWTYEYLLTQTIRSCRRFQSEAKRSKPESNSYRLGFVNALCASVRRADEARKAEAASNSRALVVLKKDALVKQFGNFSYGKSKSTAPSESSAYGRGREDGRAVDVGRRAVGSSASPSAPRLA